MSAQSYLFMLVRTGLFGLLALLVSMALFAFMQRLIQPQGPYIEPDKQKVLLDFVRLNQESTTEFKKRSKPEPPKPVEQPVSPNMQSVDVQQQQQPLAQESLNLPNLRSGMSFAQAPSLSNSMVGFGVGDSQAIALVKPPIAYPPQALSRRIEGYVRVRFEINAKGTVDKAEIIEASPPHVFERAALRAAYKYKFKPKIEGGKAVSQQATQTIEFNLQ